MNRKSTSQTQKETLTSPLPSETVIVNIATILSKQYLKEERRKKYAPVKKVLTLLGKGAILSTVFLIPNTGKALLPLRTSYPDQTTWKRYNTSYLRRTLMRLEQQKQVKRVMKNNQEVISLTHHGKRKILQYSLEDLEIDKPKHWDGKWRLVLYDIPSTKRSLTDRIRQILMNLGFYQIQRSVYVFPYSCFDQIEFIRQYYHLSDRIQYMLIEKIESDEAYKTYFGLS